MNGANRLSMSVTDANGKVTRWGPDEPNPTDIPGDLSFSTSIPGGFKDLSCSLLRRIDLDYPDQGLFDSVRVYGPGNRTVWEGRMAQFPRSHGDGFQIVPGAVGWSAHLSDDPTFTEIYVDRDISHWSGMSLEEKIRFAGTVDLASFSYNLDGLALTCQLPNQALGAQCFTNAWYTAPPGCAIAKAMYKGTQSIPAGYRAARIATSAANTSAVDVPTAVTLDDTLRTATLTAQRYVYVDMYSNASATTPAAGAHRTWKTLAVYGNHGLTTHTISGEPDGVYASDVISDIVTRAAPELVLGSIEATTYAIPHLVFDKPTTAESAIQFVNAYHGFDWGVYDNREFFYRSSDPDRLTWQARLADGARLDLEGETAEQIFNGVYIIYQDSNGTRKTVGPPGANADDTSSALEDTSATNPVNAHGIDRRWGMLEISQVTSLAGATQLGSIWLSEHGAPQRRGTLTLTGTARHPSEGIVPVSRVRAGDYVSISDHPADVPRRILETRYQHGGASVTLNLDNTPYVLDALLTRFGAGLVGVL